MRPAGNPQGQWDVQTDAEIVGRWELELEFFANAILSNSVEGKVPSNKLPNPDLCTNNISYLPMQLSRQTSRGSKVFVFLGMCFRYPLARLHTPAALTSRWISLRMWAFVTTGSNPASLDIPA
jgi:hypothetical protein